ncbi:MAG TPA: hypothetical protein VGJ60_34080 [Chloroflexota bacterium]|jgi:hypothetical protein
MSTRVVAAGVSAVSLVAMAILLGVVAPSDPILGQATVATPFRNLATLALWGALIAAIATVVFYFVDRG